MIRPTPLTPGPRLSLGTDAASVRMRIEAIERVLERSFTIPGINQPVGLDFIVGLVPVVGDIVATAMGAWIVWEARNLGMSKWQLTRMATNVGVDTLIGAIPVVGDAADFFFRSNTRNLRIIRRHLDKHHPASVTLQGQLILQCSGEGRSTMIGQAG